MRNIRKSLLKYRIPGKHWVLWLQYGITTPPKNHPGRITGPTAKQQLPPCCTGSSTVRLKSSLLLPLPITGDSQNPPHSLHLTFNLPAYYQNGNVWLYSVYSTMPLINKNCRIVFCRWHLYKPYPGPLDCHKPLLRTDTKMFLTPFPEAFSLASRDDRNGQIMIRAAVPKFTYACKNGNFTARVLNKTRKACTWLLTDSGLESAH